MAHLGGDVVGRVGGDDGGARRGRGARVGHRRQLLEVDDDRLERVARLLARLGDDRGDRLADVARELVRQGAAQRA